MNAKLRNVSKPEKVTIPVTRKIGVDANLAVVEEASGIVVLANAKSTDRFCLEASSVSEYINNAGFSTLSVDLLTDNELRIDQETGDLRFDVELLASRVIAATEWAIEQEIHGYENVAYYGANAGAAAVLCAAGEIDGIVKSIVCWGGRCDLVSPELPMIKAPTLFLVGSNDSFIMKETPAAIDKMICRSKMQVLEDAGHFFKEPGISDKAAKITIAWLKDSIKIFESV